jgi:hypothetical protein
MRRNIKQRVNRLEGIVSPTKPRAITDYSDEELERIIVKTEGCIPSEERLLEIIKDGKGRKSAPPKQIFKC